MSGARKACCSVGYGGSYEIAAHGLDAGCKWPWHIKWLPKGYGPTHDDYVICLVACPPDEDWSDRGIKARNRPALIAAICQAIEDHMANKSTSKAEKETP